MRRIAFAAATAVLLLSSCLVFPRSATEAIKARQYGFDGRSVTSICLGSLEVDRRTLSEEIRSDVEGLVPVLLPRYGLAFSRSSESSDWQVNVRVVERETMRDFVSLYSIMVSIELVATYAPEEPVITVVHTSESKSSIGSPYVLKAKLGECFKKLAKEIDSSSGKKG